MSPSSTQPSPPAGSGTSTGQNREHRGEYYDVVVIGAGQAGLAVGYHLKRRGLRFLILDAGARIGDVWRQRWDSLRLFTPAKFDGLAGMRFPAPANSFPTKDQMADYLEAYAARFALPVRTGARVKRLSRGGVGGYRVEIEGQPAIDADQVVVAMASYQRPRIPAFARELRTDIAQLHSKEYRGPAQLRPGGVLIVGAGNSGAEIAVDVAGADHRVWMAGRDVGQIPFRIDSALSHLVLSRLVLRFAFHRVLTIRTPIGRKVRPKILSQGGVLIRVKSAQLAAIGVERAPRVIGAREGLPLLDDGRTLDVANIIWCTGFHAGFSWIDLPIFNAGADGGHGEPEHEGGVVASAPGLYFVGLHFLYAFSSTIIHGVSRDAKRIVAAVAAHAPAAAGTVAVPRARPVAA